MALCSDCTSKTKYIGDGSTSKFTFDFEYMESTDVKVAQWDEDNRIYTDLVGGTDWTFDNATTIEILPAPEFTFVIYRCTDINPMKAEFFPGHPVKADDLNSNFTQLQMGLEDARCSLSELKEDVSENDWNKHDQTIKCGEEWVSDDEHISTTCAQDARFWNQVEADDNGETVTSNSERFIYSDDYIATTRAIEDRFWNNGDETTKIADGWVDSTHSDAGSDKKIPTVGAVEQRLQSVLEKEEYEATLVTGDQQRAGDWNELNTDDAHVPTTDAVAERHDTWYSDEDLVPETYIQPGKFWVNTETQRLAYWNNSNPESGYWVHVAAMPANDAPPVYVDDKEPEGSFIEEGDLWWNKTDGTLYVRYCPDPSGSCQWVDASPSFQNPVINDIKVTAPISKTDDPSGNFTTIGLNISSLNYVP